MEGPVVSVGRQQREGWHPTAHTPQTGPFRAPDLQSPASGRCPPLSHPTLPPLPSHPSSWHCP